MTVAALANLRCHRATPCAEVRTIAVTVGRTNDILALRFSLEGELSRISLTPRPEREGPVELWRHTCFEVFVGREGQAGYHEFNFAPSGQWQVYAFRSYRNRVESPHIGHQPIVAINCTDELIELDTRIVLTDLSRLNVRAPLLLGLAAIVESRAEAFSYWALHHPAGKPDFHHASAFALRLEPSEH